jgi:hypothetical protein
LWQQWGLISGPGACLACSLSLEPHPQPEDMVFGA